MTTMPRRLAVCVDDFGLHEGVNQAVFELLRLGRISAVSCLVDGPVWATGAAALHAVNQAVPQSDGNRVLDPAAGGTGAPAGPVADVGLHLNLTECLDPVAQARFPSRPLGALIRACYGRKLDAAKLRDEVDRQWRRFESVWGGPPDFIDGHQHVHQLPQVRDALSRVLRERCSPANGPMAYRPWVRRCRSPGLDGLKAGIGLVDTVKAGIIGALGSAAMADAVRALGLPTNQRLLGVYPFDTDAAGYLARWRVWLRAVRPEGDLLMCHPARATSAMPESDDVIHAARLAEFEVLAGADWARGVRDAGVAVSRLRPAS